MDTQLINFTIPKSLLRDVDFMARQKRASRSEFLREAVRNYLQNEEARNASFSIITKTAKKINLTDKKVSQLVDEAKSWARQK